MTIAFLLVQDKLASFVNRPAMTKGTQAVMEGEDDWASFSKLTLLLICRSALSYGLLTFIPLYWIHILGESVASGSTKLTLFSLTTAVATLASGYFADRFGAVRVVRWGWLLLFPTLLIFTNMHNVMLATALVIPVAFLLNIPYTPLLVMGQGFLPNRLGMASGIMLGVTVSVGGMTTPAIGWVGDHYGLHAALNVITGISFLALLFTFFLPKMRTYSQRG
jgi:FSR family fosmidomycin resistance protein-like MFS transporter